MKNIHLRLIKLGSENVLTSFLNFPFRFFQTNWFGKQNAQRNNFFANETKKSFLLTYFAEYFLFFLRQLCVARSSFSVVSLQ